MCVGQYVQRKGRRTSKRKEAIVYGSDWIVDFGKIRTKTRTTEATSVGVVDSATEGNGGIAERIFRSTEETNSWNDVREQTQSWT